MVVEPRLSFVSHFEDLPDPRQLWKGLSQSLKIQKQTYLKYLERNYL